MADASYHEDGQIFESEYIGSEIPDFIPYKVLLEDKEVRKRERKEWRAERDMQFANLEHVMMALEIDKQAGHFRTDFFHEEGWRRQRVLAVPLGMYGLRQSGVFIAVNTDYTEDLLGDGSTRIMKMEAFKARGMDQVVIGAPATYAEWQHEGEPKWVSREGFGPCISRWDTSDHRFLITNWNKNRLRLDERPIESVVRGREASLRIQAIERLTGILARISTEGDGICDFMGDEGKL